MTVCRWLLSLLVLVLAASALVLPTHTNAAGNHDLTVQAVVKGDGLYKRNRDGSCDVTIANAPNPTLEVHDADGKKIASADLSTGKRFAALQGEPYCRVDVTLSLPESTSYTFRALSVYEQTVSTEELERERWKIRITVEGFDGEAVLGESSVPYAVPTPAASPVVELPEAGPIPDSDLNRVVGSFELRGKDGEDFASLPSGCIGRGGYSDIEPGAQIVIKDESGDIIATSRLERDPNSVVGGCTFIFIAEVPDARFYTFTLGRRGDITYSRDEIERMGWAPALGIG